MSSSSEFKLGFNTYGKDRVRLVKVTRGKRDWLVIGLYEYLGLDDHFFLHSGDSSNPNKHFVEQLSVKVLLENFDPLDSKRDKYASFLFVFWS